MKCVACLGVAAAILVATGCGRSTSTAGPEPAKNDAANAIDATPNVPAVSASAPASASPPPTTFAPRALAALPRLDLEDDPKHGAIAARGWLKAHGIAPDAFVDRVYGCRVTTLGDPARDGLVCELGAPMKGSLDSGESVFPLTLWVVEGRRLREVLQVPLAAGPLDREAPPRPGDPREGQYVRLDVVLDTTGTRVEVRERSRATCASSLADVPKDAPRIAKMVRVACDAVGVYTWDTGKFVKETKTPAK